MVTIPLGTSDFRRSVSGAPFIRVRNRYFEQNPANMVEQAALIARPALRRWLAFGDGPNRGLFSQPGAFGDAMFVMMGRDLYMVKPDLSVRLIGTNFFAAGDETTRASMTATAAIGALPERLYIADGTVLRVYEPDTYARGELTLTGSIGNNEQVRIGSSYYVFTNGDVNSGAPDGTSGNPWKVAHTSNDRINLSNLRAAINDDGLAGTDYTATLTANVEARALASTATQLFVESNVIGVLGNAVVTTTTITGASWLAGTLQNGIDEGVYIIDVPEGLGAISVAAIAGYIIVVPAPRDGFRGRWYWIEPADNSILAQNFNTAERTADPLVSARAIGDQLALFGTSSTEIWYLTGDVLEPFARATSGVYERGIWEGSDVQVKDTLLLMDTDGAVYRIDGGGPRKISDASIEERTRRAIKQAVTQVGPPTPTDSALTVVLAAAGQTSVGPFNSHIFAPNRATATGGVAPYEYRWFFSGTNNQGVFGFVGNFTTELATPQVVNVNNASVATATLNCEVTDATGTRAQAVPGLTYSHQNTLPVGATPPTPTPSFTVTVTPSVQSLDDFNLSGRTFGAMTASVTGGTGPFTYLWYFEDTGIGTWRLFDATLQSTVAIVTNVSIGLVATANLRCRVTDANGNFGVSGLVSLTHINREFPDFGGFIPGGGPIR